jgi:hypothetical protein
MWLRLCRIRYRDWCRPGLFRLDSALNRDTDLSPEELDRLFQTGKAADDGGSWIVIE